MSVADGAPGLRGVPAWMAEGDSSPSEDGRLAAASADGDAYESQQARMRREFEAERQQYKLASNRGAAASSPQVHPFAVHMLRPDHVQQPHPSDDDSGPAWCGRPIVGVCNALACQYTGGAAWMTHACWLHSCQRCSAREQPVHQPHHGIGMTSIIHSSWACTCHLLQTDHWDMLL